MKTPEKPVKPVDSMHSVLEQTREQLEHIQTGNIYAAGNQKYYADHEHALNRVVSVLEDAETHIRLTCEEMHGRASKSGQEKLEDIYSRINVALGFVESASGKEITLRSALDEIDALKYAEPEYRALIERIFRILALAVNHIALMWTASVNGPRSAIYSAALKGLGYDVNDRSMAAENLS